MKGSSLTADLFCRVIDNYGDIGVCWRLARQLVTEHRFSVRLVVDDLHAFRFLAPEIDADATGGQVVLGVTVVPWRIADALDPADVVVEAFACDPPPQYVQAMAARDCKPVWLNLEYLSAESWVDDIHGRPSPHPRLPLTKYFFCPGFTNRSGGLIREGTVTSLSRSAMHLQTTSQCGPPNSPHAFVFTYPLAPVLALAEGFRDAGMALKVTTAAPLVEQSSTWRAAEPVPQPDFDELLSGFDVLLVRGEDSFVRAQWAGKPMLWHIYPTEDNAHQVKLDAWLNRYCHDLPPPAATAYRTASHAFVAGERDPAVYRALAIALPALREHALTWRARLMQQTDLATRLVRFIALVKT